ncbi:hypothetical protein BGZ63DRAFT_387193 [Mariannaea sp. PMI_226]|nr:hypothetical protein BGZ63DRAFT_387193 [Mariannaea sp. PMI_226]
MHNTMGSGPRASWTWVKLGAPERGPLGGQARGGGLGKVDSNKNKAEQDIHNTDPDTGKAQTETKHQKKVSLFLTDSPGLLGLGTWDLGGERKGTWKRFCSASWRILEPWQRTRSCQDDVAITIGSSFSQGLGDEPPTESANTHTQSPIVSGDTVSRLSPIERRAVETHWTIRGGGHIISPPAREGGSQEE